jgi:outer membrane receptor protein involved in Fe transport
MIDRVDVLTGGASSVYGADAVAGVVNFVMDTDFEGIRLDSQYSFYQHENGADDNVINALNARNFGFPTGNVADGGTFDIGLAFGVGFDDGRGHITAYAGYRHIDPVLQGKRDYSSCALTAATATTNYTCGGSATSANGTIIAYDSGGVPANFTSTFFQIGPNRTLLPGFTPYNFGPTNYFQRPDERYTAGLFAEYEISRALQPYMEFMFMDDRTVAQIAPSGDFGNTFSLNCDNPLLSAQQRSIICDTENLLASPDGTVVGQSPAGTLPFDFIDPLTGATYNRGFAQILRRAVESGPRRDDLQHTEYRVVAGMRGDLDDVWSYDAFYQYGRTNFSETYLNDFSVTRLGRALDVIDNPATPGVDPICRSAQPGGEDPACVPWDIFGRNPSAASNQYLATPGFQRGIVEETVAGASLTGNFGEWGVQAPWASSGVGVALGVEYRKEALDFRSDLAFQTGDLAGQGAPTLPVAGSYDVREVFAEVRIPIVEENFIHELSLEGGYRYSDYGVLDRSFSTDTYKIAGFFAPIRDVRFRAGYNRAVRAPNIQELFAPQRVALDGSSDPCALGRPIAATDLGCLAQGLVVGQTVAANPAAQYNGLIGGNTNLDPEVADTYTVGVVFQPGFVPRLALTVDYFDIKVDNAISTIGADTILNVCDDSQDPFFCGLINRDQFGSLWRTSNGYVTDLTQNIGGLSTSGVDIGISYSYPLDSWGNLGFQFNGTWLDTLIVDTGVSGEYDCVGLYGNVCGTPNPEWRHTARVTWNHPDGYGLSVRWRYFGHVLLDTTSDNPNLSGGVRPNDERLGDQNYIDLAANFRIGDHYNFRLGVNNLFDQQPPLTGATNCPAGPCNGNTWAQVYDALGRYIFAGVTLDF